MWWSIAGDRSWDALAKGIVLLAFGVVGLARRPRCPGGPCEPWRSSWPPRSAPSSSGHLLGKAIPALGPDDAGRVARLKGSIGYWNALALLADAALGLGLWLVASVRDRFGRPTGAMLLYAATLVLLLTQSRAGLLAGIAVVGAGALALGEPGRGGAVRAPRDRPRGRRRRVGVHAARARRGRRRPRGSRLGRRGLRRADRSSAPWPSSPSSPRCRSRDWSRPVGAKWFEASSALSRLPPRSVLLGLVLSVGNPFTWSVDQLGGSGEVVNNPGRLGSLETNNRTVWWGEAWQVFRAHPAGGTGARTFEIARKRFRDRRPERQRAAQRPAATALRHRPPGARSRPRARRRSRARAPRHRRPTRARRARSGCGPSGAPARLRPARARRLRPRLSRGGRTDGPRLGGVARRRPPGCGARGGILLRASAVVGAGAAIWVLVAPALSIRAVDAAIRQSDAGDLGAAAASARRAQGLNPLSPDPLFARATVAGLAGDTRAADTFYAQATRLQPENPATWYQLGVFRFIAGRPVRSLLRAQRGLHARPEEQPLLRGQRARPRESRGQRSRGSRLRAVGSAWIQAQAPTTTTVWAPCS